MMRFLLLVLVLLSTTSHAMMQAAGKASPIATNIVKIKFMRCGQSVARTIALNSDFAKTITGDELKTTFSANEPSNSNFHFFEDTWNKGAQAIRQAVQENSEQNYVVVEACSKFGRCAGNIQNCKTMPQLGYDRKYFRTVALRKHDRTLGTILVNKDKAVGEDLFEQFLLAFDFYTVENENKYQKSLDELKNNNLLIYWKDIASLLNKIPKSATDVVIYFDGQANNNVSSSDDKNMLWWHDRPVDISFKNSQEIE